MAKSTTAVKLDPTVQFLIDQIDVLGRFGGEITYMMVRSDPEGKVLFHAQDPRGFLTVSGCSLEQLTLPCVARLDNLGYLKSVLDMAAKAAQRGAQNPLQFETGPASDRTKTVIRAIVFDSGSTTVRINVSDPFLHKTTIRSSKITDWPTQMHFTPAMGEQFEEAARTHLVGAMKAEDPDLFLFEVDEQNQLLARFESRAGKINSVLGRMSHEFRSQITFNISKFRSVISSLGPDGGILRLSDMAASMETETKTGQYTFVMSKKIRR